MANPAVVPTSEPGSFGICVAFGQSWNTTTPTWTRLDDPSVAAFGHRAGSPHNTHAVTGWSSDRGRTYELDKTQAGTASITIEDPTGLFDPTNPASPFYGQITPMMRAKISMQNPSNLEYYDIFDGYVESWTWTMEQDESIMHLTIGLVDGFEPLTMAEIPPDVGVGTTTFVEDDSTTACQTRLNGLLDIAGWSAGSNYRNINTGNVFLQQTIYNPETTVLSAMQDVADAEFPGVANIFMSKSGLPTFYGRYPRFQPTNYPNDVNFWQVGDINAVGFGVALASNIEWALDSTHLYNASLSYPNGIAQSLVDGQLYTDQTSISKYGYRTLSLTDLIVNGQPAGGGISPQPSADANTTCLYYAQYYVMNYKTPQLRISNLQFTSRLAGDSQTWKFITGVEIGDLISVFTSNPGGGGFGKETDDQGVVSQFFVEGIHYSVTLLNQAFPAVTLTLDVSPRGWFTIAPWAS